jgi:hypothetical protein
MRYFGIFFCLLFCSQSLLSQGPEQSGYGPTNVSSYPDPKDPTRRAQISVVDGVFVKTDVPQKKMISYEYVRESDVMWSKRVWSYIDLREKMNFPLYYPHDFYAEPNFVLNKQRNSLWNIISYHIRTIDFTPFLVRNEAIEIFSSDIPEVILDGYDLRYPKYPAPGKNYLTDPDFRSYCDKWLLGTGRDTTFKKLDEEGNPITKDTIIDGVAGAMPVTVDSVIKTVYLTQDIVRYHLKTDWFFDKERSLLDHRIIAIAPVVYVEKPRSEDASGGSMGGGDEGAAAPVSDGPKLDEFGNEIVDPNRNKVLLDAEKSAKAAFEASKLGKDTLAALKLELKWKEAEKLAADLLKKKQVDKDRIDQRIVELQDLIAQKEQPVAAATGGSDGPRNFVYKELFWLYYPQLRPYLQNYYTYNDKNDAQWMSFDDLFWKTKYTQVIYKESNVYDRKIESYRKGVDALIESERIKEEIRTFEHDVWNF